MGKRGHPRRSTPIIRWRRQSGGWRRPMGRCARRRDWRGQGAAQCPESPRVAVPVNLSHKVKGIYSRPLPPSPSESGRGGACGGTGRAAGQRPAPRAVSTQPLWGRPRGPRSPAPSRPQSLTFPTPHSSPGKRAPKGRAGRGCRQGRAGRGGVRAGEAGR